MQQPERKKESFMTKLKSRYGLKSKSSGMMGEVPIPGPNSHPPLDHHHFYSHAQLYPSPHLPSAPLTTTILPRRHKSFNAIARLVSYTQTIWDFNKYLNTDCPSSNSTPSTNPCPPPSNPGEVTVSDYVLLNVRLL